MTILDQYVTTAPSAQNAVDVFRGEWASVFPEPLAGIAAGPNLLFDDGRLKWAIEEMGGVQGRHILELGPLEAGHTWMLEKGGAASVLAVEANTRAYVKCLIVKELLGIARAQFLCGDFVAYLRACERRFDVCIASGVLYHMMNPLELLGLIAKVSDRVYVWSHYLDPKTVPAGPEGRRKFPGSTRGNFGGFECTYHRYEYLETLGKMSFCGGSAPHSHWLERHDMLDAMRHFGFDDIRIAFEQPDHASGPAFAFVASKTGAR